MQKVRLEIIGMSYSQLQSGAYALILGEKDGKRRLPIIIGSFEAQAIAIELENMKPARPLTHDLFKSFAEQFAVMITEVVINKFEEGVFHALLVCFDGNHEIEIDSRTSDAVALALRFHCPIYTTPEILDTAGVVMDEGPDEEPDEDDLPDDFNPNDEFDGISDDQLELWMNEAIDKEDYERASQIRDELKNRNTI
ncbi:MAG: bifunctional nuclease family protein [Bacteroidales bacterium]|jgi:bifunctional DNase/RNase|nr:bifunctional nuclease family protein [Bacteroidales bacterium]